jgi:hypothetical protein
VPSARGSTVGKGRVGGTHDAQAGRVEVG